MVVRSEGLVSLSRSTFICYHARVYRRDYDGVRVCYSCRDASTSKGVWSPVVRLIRDGGMFTTDGALVARSWLPPVMRRKDKITL